MEEKKKDLLRKLTIVSIPFVFVAIPSVVIIVGMLSPHAAEPREGAGPLPPGRNHSLSMLSTMTGGQMILSCRAAFSGNWEYFHYFILDPYKPQQAFFQPQADPYVIFCKWGYMGNFLQDVVVFNSCATWAPDCRVDNGGCRYLFQDGHMFLVTGKHGGGGPAPKAKVAAETLGPGAAPGPWQGQAPAPAPAAPPPDLPLDALPALPQVREKKLVGDVVLRECQHVLGLFPTMCRKKSHRHEYVGKIIGRWRWWFNY
ncbi:uncharacterized protein LOC120712947 [Panicum virgatum]|uniref:DUF7771 domain-containing protein n=1 Tax=Panicum virgatum TaxID=38727 RepID=A0A8T0RJJ4_PANVG|nr:uncharacterized protein LOC120712947 [Panicum virgatum]KAG2585186.1 hypothetical protein PVAP13_6KG376800 [Panicum virgatum]